LDALSRLLSLHPVSTALDTRCQLGVPWRMEQHSQPFGIAPYHLIVEGNAFLDVDGHEPIQLQAGDMLVLPRGHKHSLYTSPTTEAAPLRHLSDTGVVSVVGNDSSGARTDILCGQFQFGTSATSTLISALPDILLVRTAGRDELASLRTLVGMLRDETNEPRPGAGAVVGHLASALFSLLLRAWLEHAHSVPGLFALMAEPRLSSALHYMLDAPGTPWTNAQLALSCHVSRATFSRLFRNTAGATPGEVLMRIRMAQAANWLTNGKLSVGQISEAVGYQSEAAFNRAFKRCIGVGPGQYRRAGIEK
jgi:AraC family transcriptional activator of mtrCDE